MNLTVGDAVLKTAKYFSGLGLPAARLEAELLLAFVLGWDRIKIYQNWDCPLRSQEIDAYRNVLRQRAQGTPMAYITGKKPFLQWDFQVEPGVLIPRPETELLVEVAISALDEMAGGQAAGLRVADLGTGSGIVAISLSKLRPGILVDACDLSEQALTVARNNARQLAAEENIRFFQGDFFAALDQVRPAEGYDLVVSNPPYIPSKEIPGLAREVRQEPLLALDGGPDGLAAYRQILAGLPDTLRPGGGLVVEHGYDQAPALVDLFRRAGFAETKSFKDLAGHDRVLWGKNYRRP
ncbi:MAG TPA: peptide chain release factor N(5)-glutamine methyltransferase [Bacillota bacterium]|jgi:release factor glutamine methyltransferase|nr:peptide chain release factor N(5)-glutamine methyltransferase [Bacillota bacterium]